jgi:signal transduction histidine kinase/ActR/RegA family two-component response regulator
MDEHGSTGAADSATLDELRARLAEAEETLRAIRQGEVDALLITDGAGERVYTLRSADAPYRALIEQMQEGAVTLTTRGDIVYSNSRFAELVDTPLQHVIGASIDRFVEDADQATLRSLIAEGAGKLRTHLRNPSRPALEAHMSVSHVVVDDVAYCTLIVTDVSTLTKVQRESQSKDQFLAMLAHELRNPLGAIVGAVQVLGLTTLRDPSASHARDVIHRQALHMARLVDDLLDVARVMTGKIVLERQLVDLGESVRSCVAGISSGHNGADRVAMSVESVWVNADPVRLEQIVSNLISNALKFSPGDRAVRVSVRAQGAEAVLSVADEGSGISPDLLPHIFDLFVQADDTSDRAKGGLGIGLTLVRQLVELHGGRIAASSRGPGEGSIFEVRLPAVQTMRKQSTASRDARAPRRAKRVLLVDDHADAREMYAMVLEADGHEVFQAEDGAAAVAMFPAVRPEVAVVDIGLPHMDGYEVARHIRAEPGGREVRLIALTGYGFPEDRERSRAAGFDRHLVKPALPEDLRRELDQIEQAAPHIRRVNGG